MALGGCADLGEPPTDPPREDLPPPAPSPDTLVVLPDRDNTLYEHPDGVLSNGAGAHVFAGTNAGGQVRRALLRFDLAAVPPGSVVSDASLRLECTRVPIDSTFTISVHRVTADWGEAGSTAPGEEGQGGAAEPGDATWTHRVNGSALWATPGGDFEAPSRDTREVTGVGPYTWGPTESLIADVQVWVDDPSSNHGWMLRGEEPEVASAKRFASRQNADDDLRPRLRLVFTPPG